QPQREQVERPLALDVAVDGVEARAEPAAHPVAEQVAAAEERQRRPGGRAEADRDEGGPPAEQDPAADGEDGRHRDRRGGNGDVDEEVNGEREDEVLAHPGVDRAPALAETLAEPLPAARGEDADDNCEDQAEREPAAVTRQPAPRRAASVNRRNVRGRVTHPRQVMEVATGRRGGARQLGSPIRRARLQVVSRRRPRLTASASSPAPWRKPVRRGSRRSAVRPSSSETGWRSGNTSHTRWCTSPSPRRGS